MVQAWALKILGVVVALVSVWGAGYLHGKKVKGAEYAEQERAASAVLADLATRNADQDRQIQEASQRKAEVRTATVVRWRDKVVALPPRDCGWTRYEWVLLRQGFCTAYPGAPDCLHDAMPDTPGTSGKLN